MFALFFFVSLRFDAFIFVFVVISESHSKSFFSFVFFSGDKSLLMHFILLHDIFPHFGRTKMIDAIRKRRISFFLGKEPFYYFVGKFLSHWVVKTNIARSHTSTRKKDISSNKARKLIIRIMSILKTNRRIRYAVATQKRGNWKERC